MNGKAILTAIAFSLSPIPALAGNGDTAFPFMRIEQNPRSAAMGGVTLWSNAACTATDDDHGHALASYQKWGPGASGFLSFEAACRLAGRYGIKAAVTRQSDPAYETVGDNGETLSTFRPGATKATLGMSMAIGQHFSAGADMHYAIRSIAEGSRYTAFAGDIAVMAVFGGFRTSAGVKSIGTTVKSMDGGSFALPSSIYLNCGYSLLLADAHEIAGAAEIDRFFYGATALSAGVRYSFRGIVSITGGYHMGGIIADHASAGIGLDIKRLCLSATCLIGHGDIKGTVLTGLGYRF